MAKYKSINKPLTRHLKSFGEPDDKDYALIKEFLPSDVKKSDIYVYSVRLCDNLLDREGEFFSSEALAQLNELLVGATGIYNHEWKSDNQHSRIYKTEVINEFGIKNESQEPYQYIVGYAYTLNSEKNRSLIDSINSGILKEVSIGFNYDKSTPYQLEGLEANRIDNITDVYEWSFVAVPAQRNAGVVKSFNKDKEVKPMELTEALAKLKTFKTADNSTDIDSIVLSLEGFTDVQAKLKSLEQDVSTKDARIKSLEQEIVDNTLNHAIDSVIGEFEFVTDVASNMARDVVEKQLTLSDDGDVKGVDEAKTLLADNYPFLIKPASIKETPAPKQEETPTAEQTGGDEPSTKSFRGLDFTRTTKIAPAVKSLDTATPTTNRGIKF